MIRNVIKIKKRNILTRARRFFLKDGKNRWDVIAELINKYGINIYAEIGIYKGGNIRRIVRRCPHVKYYLVDPYKANPNKKGGIYRHDQEHFDFLKSFVANNIKNYDAEWMYTTSLKASKKFDDDFFDMVFIDADHSYNAVKQDIKVWLPKIKPGGIIIGHDYNNRWKNDVVKAVHEFFTKKEIHIEDDAIWWVKVTPMIKKRIL